MAERLNTIVCTFDPASPKITAFDLYEWIHNTLRITEQNVTMIQIDGIKRQVFMKLSNNECVQSLLRDTNGEAKHKHPSGEVSIVGIAAAGLGTKRVRVANLPPEVADAVLMTALAPYGTVQNIHQEMWAKTYRYPVPKGIRQVSIMLTKHIPSHLTVAENRLLLSYSGQPATCYVCGETGYVLQTCPKRKHRETATARIQGENRMQQLLHRTAHSESNLRQTGGGRHRRWPRMTPQNT